MIVEFWIEMEKAEHLLRRESCSGLEHPAEVYRGANRDQTNHCRRNGKHGVDRTDFGSSRCRCRSRSGAGRRRRSCRWCGCGRRLGSDRCSRTRRSGGGSRRRETGSRCSTASGAAGRKRGQFDGWCCGGFRRKVNANGLFFRLNLAGFLFRRNGACWTARNVLSHKDFVS